MSGNQKDAFTVWLTGLSGAGKTSIAQLLESYIRDHGSSVEVLDGGAVRKTVSSHGFSKDDRDQHVRHIGFTSNLLSRNGVIAIVAAISPYRAVRDEVRSWHGDRFVEVFLSCPVETLINRDARGLYKRAIAGEIPHFSGISDPYEDPLHPQITIHTDRESKEQSARRILDWLIEGQYLPPLFSVVGGKGKG